jgi:hypothetical protein
MLSKRQQEAFSDFCDAAYDEVVLGPKTTLIVKLATAMAIGCYP